MKKDCGVKTPCSYVYSWHLYLSKAITDLLLFCHAPYASHLSVSHPLKWKDCQGDRFGCHCDVSNDDKVVTLTVLTLRCLYLLAYSVISKQKTQSKLHITFIIQTDTPTRWSLWWNSHHSRHVNTNYPRRHGKLDKMHADTMNSDVSGQSTCIMRIQCGAVIRRSVFSKIPTRDAP